MKKLLTILILLCSLSSFGQFGMFQAHNRYSTIQIEYGYLYNWYAATDVSNISNSGWSVPASSDWVTLRDYLGGTSVAGGKMKETGLTYWNTPNTGADNSSGFNGRGSGQRLLSGSFSGKKDFSQFISRTAAANPDNFIVGGILNNSSSEFLSTGSVDNKKEGHAVRLIKDSTTLSDGEFGTYTGNDGKVYRTICIGTQEWLADNLAETKYRNGDLIPEVTDGTTWSGLTTGARCVYDNDENNR